MKQTKYTLCFIFEADMSKVALIRKIKPKWQEGLLNGIGGHIEKGEKPRECCIREVEEECGIRLEDKKLKNVCWMEGKDWKVSVYAYTMETPLEQAIVPNMTAEEVIVVDPCALPKDVLMNIYWLAGLSQEMLLSDTIEPMVVKYK